MPKTDRQLALELNLDVADKIFGLAWVRKASWIFQHATDHWICDDEPWQEYPGGIVRTKPHVNICLGRYGQTMEDAMDVVSRMAMLGFDFTMDKPHDKPFRVTFFRNHPGNFTIFGPGNLPFLICTAALKAMATLDPVPR